MELIPYYCSSTVPRVAGYWDNILYFRLHQNFEKLGNLPVLDSVNSHGIDGGTVWSTVAQTCSTV